MKIKRVWLGFIMLLGFSLSQSLASSEARISLKVINDDGIPVTNFPVNAGFYDADKFHGLTDTNGSFTMEGHAGYIHEANWILQKTGYYYSGLSYQFKDGVKNGKLQPWDPVVTAVVRRVVNPIPMYAKNVRALVPVLDEFLGYDLMKGDWVTPHGNGQVSDLVFKMQNRFVNVHDFATSLELQFTNVIDGMQEVPLSSFAPSDYALPRMAPFDGYTRDFRFTECSTNYLNPNEDRSFLFRVRTETNSAGKIVSAFYGKIRGNIHIDGRWSKTGSILFNYYLNPTPNDRNLEFDPKRNLLTPRPGEIVNKP